MSHARERGSEGRRKLTRERGVIKSETREEGEEEEGGNKVETWRRTSVLRITPTTRRGARGALWSTTKRKEEWLKKDREEAIGKLAFMEAGGSKCLNLGSEEIGRSPKLESTVDNEENCKDDE